MPDLGVEALFFVLGSILTIGYVGELISRRFKVSSVLILLLIGYVLRISGYFDINVLLGLQEFFGTLALIVLLFDGGLFLNLVTVLTKSSKVILQALLTTIFGIFACGLIFQYVFGIDFMIGAIFGAIAGGIGSTTSISIARNIGIQKNIINFIILESSITDVFSIILTIVLTGALLSGSIEFQTMAKGLASTFSTGILISVIAGLLYILFFSKIERGYSYMMTLSIVLLLYSVVNVVGGSGAIAVLIFGMMVGNEHVIKKFLKISNHENQNFPKQFQSEISFLIRTFFFVYLGMVVHLGDVNNFFAAVLIIISLYIVRYVALYISTSKSSMFEHINALAAINPRGLATAVLATYPLQVLEARGSQALKPEIVVNVKALPEIAFYTIILSIIFTTLLVPYSLKKNDKK